LALFDRKHLNEGVRPREVFAWSMYDFANSGYTTVVLTAVFNAYFVGVVAQKASWATLAWTLALSASYALTMLVMPPLGAWCDLHANKKRMLALATIGCVGATVVLAGAGRGDLWLAIFAIIASNFFYSVGESLTAAFLPELARNRSLGKVSGWGWSFGYFGGMLSLGLCLAYVLSAQKAGQTADQFVPVTMLITAAVYGLAAVPTFLWLRERAVPRPGAEPAGARAAVQRLRQTWREAQRYRDFIRLLACGACYQAGIAVVITLAAVYAEQVMRFEQAQTMVLIFLVNIASAVGAFAFGYGQDRLGHKKALAITLVGWIAMVLLACLAVTPAVFWLASVLAGLCMGSSQSCGRAMVGALTPPDRLAEFYGLWSFATRVASIVGPITYGVVTFVTAGNHRLAFLLTGLFFVAGLVILRRIDTDRGAKTAMPAT
jgi:UMF1 family MFS transporter